MKRVLRILLIVIAFILATAVILPFAFKGKLVNMVKQTANKNLEATVDFSKVSLSFFRHFPHLSLSIHDLSIANHAPFEGDTLAAIRRLKITIDLWQLFGPAPYEIRRVDLVQPKICLKALADGRVNWDIAKAAEDSTVVDTAASGEGFTLRMKKLVIEDGHFIYDDKALPVYVNATGVAHTLSGNLNLEQTTLKTFTTAENVTVTYDGITYLRQASGKVIADIEANLNTFHFAFTNGELYVNALKVLASGWFAMPEAGYDMDIQFAAPGTDFREALSLVPAVYSKDFEKVQTSGSFSLKGRVHGLYSDTTIPGFDVEMDVSDARFQYPDLPAAVEDIQLQCRIINPDGVPDNTIINLSRFHMIMAGTPVDASLYLKTPVSDPDIRAQLKGKLDLADVTRFYPLEGTSLEGLVDANVALEGRQSMLDQKEYEKFKAEGRIEIANLKYAATDVPEMNIPVFRLAFNPAFLRLEDMQFVSGPSSLKAQGELTQYLGWFLRDEVLKGNLRVMSPRLDLNSLLGQDNDQTKAEPSADSGMTLTAPLIPTNIDFVLSTQVSELLFGDMNLQSVQGEVIVRDGSVMLNGLSMRTWDGEIKAKVKYTHTSLIKPEVDMDLSLNGISISKAYEASGLMRKLAPVARHVRGNVTTGLKLQGQLDENLNPVYASLNGAGNFSTTSILVTGLPVMQKIADVAALDMLREATLQPVSAFFAFSDGKVEVKPFKIKVKEITADVSGTTGFDQTLAYVMKMQFPRSIMGNQADALVSGWLKQAQQKGLPVNLGSTINLDVLIGGTIKQPEVRTGLAGMAASLQEEIRQAVQEKVEEIKSEIKEEVRQEISKKAQEILKEAERQAASIMEEAGKQADAVRNTAAEAAKKLRQETDAQAARIIAEGKSRGPIAASLAEKSAEKVKKEGYDKATALEKEANQKADALMQEAKKKSDQVLEEGNKRAQAI